MKKLLLLFVFGFISGFILAQNYPTTQDSTYIQDEFFIDTTEYKNYFGLNIYPILGIFGNSRMPNMKISLQYKHLFDNFNVKASINFSDFYKESNTYIVRMEKESAVISEGVDSKDSTSMYFRKHNCTIYSFDGRIGAEYKFGQKNASVFIGGNLLFGLYKTNEVYSVLKESYKDGMMIPINFDFDEQGKSQYRDISYLKLGADINVGVDFKIARNFFLTIQYSPEFVYLKKLNETKHDPQSCFSNDNESGFMFIPYFIDLILAIKF